LSDNRVDSKGMLALRSFGRGRSRGAKRADGLCPGLLTAHSPNVLAGSFREEHPNLDLAAPVARREAEPLPHLLHAVSGLSATQNTSRDPTPRGDARERARADGSEDREPVPREALRLRRSPGPARFENKLPALAARAGRR